MDRYLVIIPAYNEENKIASVIQSAKEFCPGADIVVVNDGSDDKTSIRVAETGARSLSHPFNLGYGTALQTGYKYALEKGYEAIVQMDGDGQHDPACIADLIAVVQKGEADIAIGSRFLSVEDGSSETPAYRAPLMRRLGMGLFRLVTSIIIGQKVTDPTSGFQAMNSNVLEWASSDRFPCDYPDADVIIMLHRAGFRIQEVPVRMFPSGNKKSMHSGWNPLYYLFKMFLSILVTLMRK